jgi:hypothetical protein
MYRVALPLIAVSAAFFIGGTSVHAAGYGDRSTSAAIWPPAGSLLYCQNRMLDPYTCGNVRRYWRSMYSFGDNNIGRGLQASGVGRRPGHR